MLGAKCNGRDGAARLLSFDEMWIPVLRIKKKFKFDSEKSKLAGIIRGSFLVIKSESLY